MKSKQPIFVYVEDDEPSVTIMKMVVERVMKSATLHVLKSNDDFVRQVKGLGAMPDIFLLDIHMRPYSGFELLSMLRDDPQLSKSKVIALTASVTNKEVSLLKNGGFDGAIAKPLNIDAFPSMIAKIINGESVWYIV